MRSRCAGIGGRRIARIRRPASKGRSVRRGGAADGRDGDPDPTSAGTAGDAARCGGSSAEVGMTANPFGAHQVGHHRVDRRAADTQPPTVAGQVKTGASKSSRHAWPYSFSAKAPPMSRRFDRHPAATGSGVMGGSQERRGYGASHAVDGTCAEGRRRGRGLSVVRNDGVGAARRPSTGEGSDHGPFARCQHRGVAGRRIRAWRERPGGDRSALRCVAEPVNDFETVTIVIY